MNTVRLDTARLDEIAAHLKTNIQDVIKMAAFEIEADAKVMAPVDTGAMRSSVYTVTQDEDHYGDSASGARQQNPDVITSQHPKPTGNVYARVGPSVEYAQFVELGTSKMAAQPFLMPAAEKVARKLNNGEYWQELIK